MANRVMNAILTVAILQLPAVSIPVLAQAPLAGVEEQQALARKQPALGNLAPFVETARQLSTGSRVIRLDGRLQHHG